MLFNRRSASVAVDVCWHVAICRRAVAGLVGGGAGGCGVGRRGRDSLGPGLSRLGRLRPRALDCRQGHLQTHHQLLQNNFLFVCLLA